MSDRVDLKLLINGHVPIIYVESFEEKRALEVIKNIALELMQPVFRWSVTEGMRRLDVDLGAQRHISEPAEVLKHIKATQLKGIYVMLDFHPYLADPLHQRLIREIAMSFEGQQGKLVFISPSIDIPSGLSKLAVNFQLSLPNREQLRGLIEEEAVNWHKENGARVKADSESLDRLIQNLSGLTYKDSRRLIRNAVMDDNAITESDLPAVMDAKYSLMNQDGILAFEYDTARFSEVGGMRKLKSWLKQRQAVFQGVKDLPKGLDKPKGVLLLGVQGGGKSLAAKAVAGVWGVPLLRMDFGALYNKYIGETEKNIRKALQTAEVMAPCVLWIDEIEKGVASGGDEDGTSKRILATLLTWMAENKHSVFVVATANQIDDLPPELIRKGRLDEIFFVDLPVPEVREEIFKIHLQKREIPLEGIDLPRLAEASEGFSGAEIEQAVVAVIYSTLHQEAVINTENIEEEIQKTRPLSVVMAEQVAYLRMWAKDRTVLAD